MCWQIRWRLARFTVVGGQSLARGWPLSRARLGGIGRPQLTGSSQQNRTPTRTERTDSRSAGTRRSGPARTLYL